MKLTDLLETTVILADGAMGTMLHARGIGFDRCFDELNRLQPALVAEVHRAYIEAGAEVIQTNTFGANRYKLAAHGLDNQVSEINRSGVELARRVVMASYRNVWVAGDVGPLGVRLAPFGRVQPDQARQAFGEQIRALAEAGADLFLVAELEHDGPVLGIDPAEQADHPAVFVDDRTAVVEMVRVLKPGGLFLFAQMDWWNFGHVVGRFWPVIFILLGISMLVGNNFKNVGSGVFFILFGTFFLLVKWNVIHTIGRYIWPVAIIGAGLWILVRPDRGGGNKKIPDGVVGGDELSVNQVLSGTVRRVESQAFRGGKVEVVFGSAEIDLRGAKPAGGQATLDASAVLGGIEVTVPRDWEVVLEGSPVLGSIESHKSPVPATGKTATLTIRGSAVLGSIEVKD